MFGGQRRNDNLQGMQRSDVLFAESLKVSQAMAIQYTWLTLEGEQQIKS